jgi:hypothetical protein
MINYKRLLLLVALWLAPSLSYASDSFRDAFQKYLELRALEHQLSGLEYRSELDPVTKVEKKSKLAAAATQKRIEFQAILSADKNEFSSWEKSVLERLENKKARRPASNEALDKDAIEYLTQLYPNSRRLSALEWLAIKEWFGIRSQEAFLRISFGIQKAPENKKADASIPIVLVRAPFQKLSAQNSSHHKTNERWLKASESATEFLVKSGFTVKNLELSAFTKIDEQAEELFRSLKEKIPGEFVLASIGEASAIVSRALDLHPELRHHQKLMGWLNFNGRLYGLPPAPASAEKKNKHFSEIESALVAEIYRLHQEIISPVTPMGKGFPIFNLVSFENNLRPAINLRESLVPEGESFFLEPGTEMAGVRQALHSLGRSPASANGKTNWKENPRLSDPTF